MQNNLACSAEANDLDFVQRVLGVLALIEYRPAQAAPWRFHVGCTGNGDPYLQVQFDGVDAISGLPAVQHGRKWLLSVHMTKSEIVQTALKAVMTAEEHEIRERFKYRGRRIFGPHFDVDALHEICDGQHLDVRSPN